MAFFRKRRFTSKRRFTRRSGAGAKALSMVKKLKKQVGHPELKYFDSSIAAANITNAGTIYQLDEVAQGDGEQSRDGVQIYAKSNYIRMLISHGQTANASNTIQNVRVIIFEDKQPTAAPPVSTDLLVSATVYSPLNMYNRRRFKVLTDKNYNLEYNATAAPFAGPSTSVFRKIFKRISEVKVYEQGANQVQSGKALYMYVLSDQAAAGYPTITYWNRLRFIDN